MVRYYLTVWCVVVSLYPGENALPPGGMDFLPRRNVLNIVPEFLGQSPFTPAVSTTTTTELLSLEENQVLSTSVEVTTSDISSHEQHSSTDEWFSVKHAGVPRGLAVYPLPLKESDHELMFNVSWQPALGTPARDYSIEVRSVTDTVDCKTPLCYEYNIPGSSLWWLVPAYSNHVEGTCAVRPGCAYAVRLTAHPWDGFRSANLHVELDECVAGVCTCAHAPRLPAPAVRARTVAVQGELFVNVSWTLPKPAYPQRLPPTLRKQYYFVSIGKQMVSDAHPAPWFAHSTSRKIDADGPVSTGDDARWLLLPVVERSGERGGERGGEKRRTIVLDIKLLARVSLIDDRGCVGPSGNATAYDPAREKKIQLGTYVLWAVFGGACVLAIVAILAVSSRAVKRILKAIRPSPVSAPLEPLCRRPAWFPLQLRT